MSCGSICFEFFFFPRVIDRQPLPFSGGKKAIVGKCHHRNSRYSKVLALESCWAGCIEIADQARLVSVKLDEMSFFILLLIYQVLACKFLVVPIMIKSRAELRLSLLCKSHLAMRSD